MNRCLQLWAGGAATAAAVALTVLASAANSTDINTRVAETLSRFYAQSDTQVELAQKASAVLVFPRITKAGAGIGGEYGEGALQVQGKTVGYYKVTGGSVGATLGVADRSEVILFMTAGARDHFMHSRGWTIGADAGVALVKGVGGEYDSETLRKPVLAFVFGEKGLIADASLEGAKVSRLDAAGVTGAVTAAPCTQARRVEDGLCGG